MTRLDKLIVAASGALAALIIMIIGLIIVSVIIIEEAKIQNETMDRARGRVTYTGEE